MSDEISSEVAELREKIREIKVLIDSPIWKQYSDLVESQCNGRVDQMILTPLSGFDAALAQEYAKGEIAGMRLALQVLPQLIEDTETAMNELEPGNE